MKAVVIEKTCSFKIKELPYPNPGDSEGHSRCAGPAVSAARISIFSMGNSRSRLSLDSGARIFRGGEGSGCPGDSSATRGSGSGRAFHCLRILLFLQSRKNEPLYERHGDRPYQIYRDEARRRFSEQVVVPRRTSFPWPIRSLSRPAPLLPTWGRLFMPCAGPKFSPG